MVLDKMNQIDLSISIVNYNTGNLLSNCLNSIIKNTHLIIYEIIVVDNNSTDNSINQIKINFPNITIIENKENFGFTRANNQAFKEAKGRYFLLLNPDTLVLDGALDKMVAYLDTNSEVGIVGSKILDGKGEIKREAWNWKFPNLLAYILDPLCRFKFQYKLLKFIWPKNNLNIFDAFRDYNKTQEVDWVCGCCLMIRSPLWHELEGMDEEFFMYSEELDLCFRAKKKGWRVMYYPDTEIIHFGGEGIMTPGKKIEELKSGYLFIRKHYGLFSLILWKIFRGTGITLRLIKYLIFKRKDKKNLNIYWTAFKWSISAFFY